jgi:hypothetical protein
VGSGEVVGDGETGGVRRLGVEAVDVLLATEGADRGSSASR